MEKKKKIIAAAAAVLALLAAIFAAVLAVSLAGKSEQKRIEKEEENSTGISINDIGGLEYGSLYAYSGAFVEDGTDEEVENVAALSVKNNSSNAYQTVSLKVKCENGEEYEFFITALLPGKAVAVLEKNRKQYDGTAPTGTPEITESSFYAFSPDLNADSFEINAVGSVINLKNISDRDFTNDVYVYYKNTADGNQLGGITYRVNFGALKAGELSQRSSLHFSADNSEILYITYGE